MTFTMSKSDRIDFADLKSFLAIVRCRSFKLAAIELGQTPSAVSHAMRRLEDRLGAKLLNRSSRSVSATAAGRDLAGRLEDGFNLSARRSKRSKRPARRDSEKSV